MGRELDPWPPVALIRAHTFCPNQDGKSVKRKKSRVVE